MASKLADNATGDFVPDWASSLKKHERTNAVLRIGFDISQTGRQKAGCGFYTDGLIRALAAVDRVNEYILYPTFGDSYFDPLMPPSCPIKQDNIRYGLRHPSFEKAQHFWRYPPPDYEATLGDPDIIHANNFFCPTARTSARVVYTLYDLSFLDNPEWTTERNRVGCFSGTFNSSLCADRIVAISDYSRRHFLTTFPHFPADRISVVYPASRFRGCEAVPTPSKLSRLKPECFWLCVGSLEPRKNHLRLLRAYAKLKRDMGHTWPLVLAGGRGWLTDDFQEQVGALELSADVIMTGYVDDAALQWLYQNCFAALYPSLFEGFGLPVLEAMTLGAPIITSNNTSIPEIVGPDGLLIDPMQEDEIYHIMRKLATGEIKRETLKQYGFRRAAQFTWEGAARKMLTLYAETASWPKRWDFQ